MVADLAGQVRCGHDPATRFIGDPGAHENADGASDRLRREWRAQQDSKTYPVPITVNLSEVVKFDQLSRASDDHNFDVDTDKYHDNIIVMNFNVTASTIYSLDFRDPTRSGRPTLRVVMINGQPYTEFLKFLRNNVGKYSTQRKYAQAIESLLKFTAVHADEYINDEKRGDLFNAWAHALRYGTWEEDLASADAGEAKERLWWRAKTYGTTKVLMDKAARFSDWLVAEYNAKGLNPMRRATLSERWAQFWRWHNHIKSNSKLSHLKNDIPDSAYLSRATRAPGSGIKRLPTIKWLRDEVFEELYWKGFAKKTKGFDRLPYWRKYNVEAQMMTLLMFGAGLRVSEPLHLFVEDIHEDPSNPGSALVSLGHPTDAKMSWNLEGQVRRGTRTQYLQEVWGLAPRFHKGEQWKGGMVDSNNYINVYFYHPEIPFSQIFFALYKLYLQHVRPMYVDHPYLFVTRDGKPRTAHSFREKVWNPAMRRIGIEPTKATGTTPHGCRHSYGRRIELLKNAGVLGESHMQATLHHTNPSSQLAYQGKTPEEVTNVLEQARLSNSGKNLDPIWSIQDE